MFKAFNIRASHKILPRNLCGIHGESHVVDDFKIESELVWNDYESKFNIAWDF